MLRPREMKDMARWNTDVMVVAGDDAVNVLGQVGKALVGHAQEFGFTP